MPALHDLTASEQLDRLRRGELSPLELTEHYLDRIERLDRDLGAFATVTPEAARHRAASLEHTPRSAPLWGLPVAEKDLVARAGVRTMYGSRLMADFVPETSDELVEVMDGAGSVSLGKTNTPEFGMPSYTESLVAPPARSPWDPALGAGGSSGGAAVAVAAGLLPVAIGSDGGGSVRIPAAATGLVGLKPSRGRVPALGGYGQIAGLPTAGPITRTVADAALVLDAIAARSPWSTGPPRWDGGAFLNAAMRGEGRFQLAVMTTSPWDSAYPIEIAPEALTALALAERELSGLGHGLEPISLAPDAGYAPAFRTVWQAGAATLPAETEEELALLEPLTRWLVGRGRSLGARDLQLALQELSGFERRVIGQFAPYDAVLTPALAMTPRPVGWYDGEDGERNFQQQVQYTPWTSFVNVSGLPAIVLPVQLDDAGPMGVQLIGRPGREDVLFSIGAQLEARLRWQDRHPPVWHR